jgi:hypothetical protein
MNNHQKSVSNKSGQAQGAVGLSVAGSDKSAFRCVGMSANCFPFGLVGLVGLSSVLVRFPNRGFWGENAKKFGLVGFARFPYGRRKRNRRNWPDRAIGIVENQNMFMIKDLPRDCQLRARNPQ